MKGAYCGAMIEYIVSVAEAAAPQAATIGACDFAKGKVSWDCIPIYINGLTGIVVTLAASIALIMVMVNGFRYMLGPATEGSSDAAKKGIMHALLGMAVALLAYIILDTIIRRATGS